MRIIGLMSGTSVDGIDVAIADVTGQPAELTPDTQGSALRATLLHFETVPWDEAVRTAIFDLFTSPAPVADWCRLDASVASYFAAAALTALAHSGYRPESIDLIGSHGQTLWHEVADGRVHSTLQIGAPSLIATQTGITTVGNFRVADVAARGQGAPLVSTFDWHLLRPPAVLNGIAGGWRAVQNIGGIANVTFLPPVGVDAPPLAFDTGPGNALIDWAASRATAGRLRYDEDGGLAAAGLVADELLARWLAHPYFDQAPPKTTGRELFSQALAEEWAGEAAAHGLRPVDLVATLTELTAATIAAAYRRFAPAPVAQVVVGGGGGRNPVLMARLAHHLQQELGRAVAICTHEALGINSDAKEALAFAVLAYLTLHGWPGNVPACTGAARPVILGEVAPGRNYRKLLHAVVGSTAGASFG
jgi:anhydro-N-acetylmuramic acid kinase